MGNREGLALSRDRNGMTATRWKQIETVFEQALELPTEERQVFLQRTCNGDEELRREVQSLLDSHSESGSFIDDRSQFYQEFDRSDSPQSQVIGHYRVVRELGRGGMGAVYLAERADEYKKLVAIKLIKRGMDTDSVLRRFRNERQILAGFDHPNVARLFDGGTTEDGLPYFVMEYIEGLPIDEYCNRAALSIPDRLKLFREVCAAVSYAHRHLVIHRDIKRSNILVTADGVPKLLDFGIAKILQTGEGAPTFATMTGLRLMTPEYASPEQVRGEPVTTATDVYSLGVILYELLTGQFPYHFSSQTPRDIEHAITTTQPDKPSTVTTRSTSSFPEKLRIENRKRLRGDLDNIVLMALRKEPERRYQSVEQFSEDIRRHLEARPIFARKDTAGYRAGKFVRRNKVALAAAALIFLSLVGGIIATNSALHRAEREKTRAERRFNDVRKLANSVLFDYHDAIKDLPGATKVRERLVKDALNYLDSLAAEAHGDPALQRELAAAYERVGDVRGGKSSGSLGDIAGAIESYTKALGIREAVVARNPTDARARRDLATSHQKIGDRLIETSEPSKGLEHLREARKLYLGLTRERPADDGVQLEFAVTCNKLGQALKLRGDIAEALEQHREALTICERLTSRNPRDQRYRRELWTAHEGIAAALFMQRDIAGAIEANGKALALGEALIAEDAINTDYRRQLVLNYKNAGDYRRWADKTGALEYFRKALKLEEELLAADPANAVTRKDLGYTHVRLADFLENLGDYAQSLSHYRQAREIYQKLVSDAPQDLPSRIRVATCGAGIAGMQARLGEVDLALQECDKANALLSEITEEKTNAHHRFLRAQVYEYLGNAYVWLAAVPQTSASEMRHRRSAARAMFQKSFDVLEDLRSRGVLDPASAKWAQGIADNIADCDKALVK
jgi:serine/threonine protein kinase